MADNCYRKKSNRDEYGEQESRLTSRHIQTLGLLQDLHRENGEFKSRIEELEAELKNCTEYHSIAKDAKAFKQKAQEDCLKQIDKNNESLARKHKDEVMSLVSAKLQAETEWLEEKEQLQKLISQHEKQNAVLTEQLESLKKHDLKVDVVNQQLDRSIQEMMELKETNSQLNLQILHLEERENSKATEHLERLQDAQSQKEALTLELQEAKQRLREFELRMKVLEEEIAASRKSAGNQERHSARTSKLKQQLEKANEEVSDCRKRIAELEEYAGDLRKELAERTGQLQQEAATKDKLMVLLQQLQGECNALRELLAARDQEKKGAMERVGFREFVQMRREMNRLKEENDWLRDSRKKPKSLPSLKSASPESYPVNDVGQKNSNRTFGPKPSKSETALQVYRR